MTGGFRNFGRLLLSLSPDWGRRLLFVVTIADASIATAFRFRGGRL